MISIALEQLQIGQNMVLSEEKRRRITGLMDAGYSIRAGALDVQMLVNVFIHNYYSNENIVVTRQIHRYLTDDKIRVLIKVNF